MKIIQSLLTNNPCFKEGKKIIPKGFMLHSVGVNQPNATVFVRNWNKSTYDRACVHAFIDANDGAIHQTLPWNHRGWHGGGLSNNTHIGVEMCEPASIKYTGGANFTCSDIEAARKSANLTYKAAVELCAMLCDEYNLDPSNPQVVTSHSEGFKLGISSNHADPEHLWKGLKLPYTMHSFRNDVKLELGRIKNDKNTEIKPIQELYRVRKSWEDAKSQKGAFSNLTSAKKIADENKGYHVYNQNGSLLYSPVMVNTLPKTPFRVSAKNINIHNKPHSKNITQSLANGVFTIVDRYDNWGLLKSYQNNRNGWLDLNKVRVI